MSKFLINEELIEYAKEYFAQNMADDMLRYIIEDFESRQMSALYDRFVTGEWSDEEGYFIDFYPLYFMGTLKELEAYFMDFLDNYSNMPQKELNKTKKLLVNKVNEFLELVETK